MVCTCVHKDIQTHYMQIHMPYMQMRMSDMQIHMPDMQIHMPDMQIHMPDMQIHMPNMQIHMHDMHDMHDLPNLPNLPNLSSMPNLPACPACPTCPTCTTCKKRTTQSSILYWIWPRMRSYTHQRTQIHTWNELHFPKQWHHHTHLLTKYYFSSHSYLDHLWKKREHHGHCHWVKYLK